jgi:PAT family acetyl-CoA transporter-like MFS transporter 1
LFLQPLVQFLIAVICYALAVPLSEWIGYPSTPSTNDVPDRYSQILKLTFSMFVLIFLVATQDIAVDGWAVHILPPKYISYASSCQSIGQNIGYFLTYSLFLAFHDPRICKFIASFLGMKPSEIINFRFVSVEGCIKAIAISYILVNIFLLFVSENFDEASIVKRKLKYIPSISNYNKLKNTYIETLNVIRFAPSLRKLMAILLTARIAFMVAESALVFKVCKFIFFILINS